MRATKLLVISCLALSAYPDRCPGAGADEDSRKLARLVIAGQRDSRERLTSGIFRAKGTAKQVHHDLPKVDFETNLSFFSAFDYRRRQLRIDHEQMQRMGTGDLLPMGGKFARTPEQALIFSGMSRESNIKRIGIRPPNWLPGSRFSMFDVRTVGAVNYHEFQQGLRFDVTPDRLFDRERGLLTEEKLAEAVAESDRVTRVSWIYGDHDLSKRTIWFDRKQGYSPIRVEDRTRKNPTKPIGPENPAKWYPPDCTGETSWKEIAGVWVPESMTITMRGITKQRDKPSVVTDERTISLSFTWESVNEAVPERLFTIEGFDVPNPLVVDHRLGDKPIIIRHPTIKDPKKLRKFQELPATDESASLGTSFSVWKCVILGANGLALVALAFYWYRRRVGG